MENNVQNGVIGEDTVLKCKYCGKNFTLTKEELNSPNVVICVCKDDTCLKSYAQDAMTAELQKAKNSSPEADIAKKLLGK